MRSKHVLILGGTAESRELARLLIEKGCRVTTSLAGATSHPHLPEGAVRIGGFGGEVGIANYLASAEVEAVADATHPFAAQISRHAAAAAQKLHKLYIRLERPAWSPSPNDNWTQVADAKTAAQVLAAGARVLLTVGRKEIDPFLARADIAGIVRMIETPAREIPDSWSLLQARPPFTIEAERALMYSEQITHLVTKNSGGPALRPKLDAARERNIPVIMIARPRKPDAPTATDAEGLAALLLA